MLFISIALLLKSCNVSSYDRYQQNLAREQEKEQQRIEYQRQLKRDYQVVLQIAANKIVSEMVNIISPKSGRDAQYKLYLDDIVYYERENIVAVKGNFYWLARDFWTSVPYGQCNANGNIFVYLNSGKAYYEHESHNEHLIKVSNTSDLNKIKKGFEVRIN